MQTVITEYMTETGFDVLENANKYPGPTGLLSYVAEKALDNLVYNELPEDVVKLHLDGKIYVHKLPYSLFIPYCAGHSIRRLLEKGLKTPTITARPARHFDTFVDHVANYLISMQHYFSGAQAFGAVELYAGPFIRRDGLRSNYVAVKQGVQRLIYNLNFPSRVGMQTPFSNFTIVLDTADKLLEDPAVYAGKEDGRLKDYLDEAILFARALAEVHMEGDATGRPFTFPILTYMTTSKILYDDPELFEAVFSASARRGTGYWLNTKVVDPNASLAMCCRLVLDKNDIVESMRVNKPMRMRMLKKELEGMREEYIRRLEKQRMGGLWAMPDITGSKAVVTVNIPRLVLETGRDDTQFWELLDETLEVVRRGLIWFAKRYAKMARMHPSFYMMPLEYLPEVFKLIGTPYFLTVGVLGLPEAVALMEGDPVLWSEGSSKRWLEATEWMRKVVRHIVKKTREWSKKTGIPFNVEEVPGESAAAKLARKDARLYPELLKYVPDREEPIYSTSIAPYYAPMEIWERVAVEEKVQPEFTGGVMMHIFLGEEPNPETLAKFTRRLTEHTRLVYWSYTPAISVCPKCGWNTIGFYSTCPRCGSNTEVWSRIIGYYRPLHRWNTTRRREFWYRFHYTL